MTKGLHTALLYIGILNLLCVVLDIVAHNNILILFNLLIGGVNLILWATGRPEYP